MPPWPFETDNWQTMSKLCWTRISACLTSRFGQNNAALARSCGNFFQSSSLCWTKPFCRIAAQPWGEYSTTIGAIIAVNSCGSVSSDRPFSGRTQIAAYRAWPETQCLDLASWTYRPCSILNWILLRGTTTLLSTIGREPTSSVVINRSNRFTYFVTCLCGKIRLPWLSMTRSVDIMYYCARHVLYNTAAHLFQGLSFGAVLNCL